MPQMSRTSLSKLENGYRESVTVPELLVLASVLDVAPMALLFGHGIDDKTEMLPGQHCEPWDAVQWFTGPRWLAAHADAGPGGNAMSANPDGAGRRIARLLAEGMRRREPDLCARCGNQFPPEQVCARCQTDSGTLTAAAVIVRNRSRRNGFWTRVLARVLELAAARLEAK